MKRKIIGIFVIAMLTISYMPIAGCEEYQVSKSYENKGDDIKIFFIGKVNGCGGTYTLAQSILAYFGVYKEISQQNIHVGGNNFLYIDGKIEHIEAPYTITLHNFSGFGTPFNMVWLTVKMIIPPISDIFGIFTGSCESYEVQNVTGMAT